jgi:hypothetical protein
MGIARSICMMKRSVLVMVVLSCIGVSVISLVLGVFPRVENILMTLAAKYDALFPEITIRNGHASIREKQPHFLDNFDEKDILAVIDTRVGSQNEAMNYLKGAKVGAVLTATTIIIKNDEEIRIIPLQEVPDMVLNSQNIKSAFEELLPRMTHWAIILVAIYFMMVKPLQIIVLALLPYWVAQLYSVALTYAQAIRIAAAGMVVAVSVDFVAIFIGIGMSTSIFLYFMLYVLILVLATMNLFRDSRSVSDQGMGIHPS